MGRKKTICGERAATILQSLDGFGLTVSELTEFVPVPAEHISNWLRERYENEKDVYICGYALDSRNRPFIPVWTVGNRENTPRPGRPTSTARVAAWRARRKLELQGERE